MGQTEAKEKSQAFRECVSQISKEMITLSCDGIEPGAKKKGNKRLIAKLGRRKLQLKCKFCFVFQRSFADKFSVSCAFFLHEQRVSLRLPLSVFSEIIISWNKQFCTKKSHFT